MEAHPLIHWFQTSDLNYWATKTRWVFVTCQSMHFMGLSILLGAIVTLDLRILGLMRSVAIERFYPLIPLALVGFGIQLATGLLMFSAEPLGYWMNAAFRLKLIVIALSGLNALAFWLFEHRRLARLPPEVSAGLAAKLIAGASIAMWILVITCGRFIPYLSGVPLPRFLAG